MKINSFIKNYLASSISGHQCSPPQIYIRWYGLLVSKTSKPNKYSTPCLSGLHCRLLPVRFSPFHLVFSSKNLIFVSIDQVHLFILERKSKKKKNKMAVSDKCITFKRESVHSSSYLFIFSGSKVSRCNGPFQFMCAFLPLIVYFWH